MSLNGSIGLITFKRTMVEPTSNSNRGWREPYKHLYVVYIRFSGRDIIGRLYNHLSLYIHECTRAQ
ncbi:hypothetical protein HanIR_Chr02g0084131 [Helianthus annuus]|nr:hypothetical protein HanIR_Chr02g0084131 [Helianthus annuus]